MLKLSIKNAGFYDSKAREDFLLVWGGRHNSQKNEIDSPWERGFEWDIAIGAS